jgi:hypothetical protein
MIGYVVRKPPWLNAPEERIRFHASLEILGVARRDFRDRKSKGTGKGNRMPRGIGHEHYRFPEHSDSDLP